MVSLPSLERYSTAFVVCYTLVYLITIVCILNLNHPIYGDEGHFYRTTLRFANEPALHTLQTYEEMSTPLPFILYAVWSKITTNELSSLRIFSLLISFCTFLSIYVLFKNIFIKTPIIPILAVILFSIIPYTPGLSLFIYTDMLAILFMVLAFIGFMKNKPTLFLIFSIAAVFCRQYLIFFTIAVMCYSVLNYFFYKKRGDLIFLIAAILANCSLLPLFYLWNGLTPNNVLKKLYINEHVQFHPDALLIYSCYLILYTSPLLLLMLPTLFKNKKTIVYAFLFSFLYWLFPISTSKPALAAGFMYIGLFHKALAHVITSSFYIGLVYQLLLFVASIFFFHKTEIIFQSIRMEEKKHLVFSGIALVSFLLIMPFSYLTWEKYCLPAIPFVYILFFETPEIQEKLNKFSLLFIKEN